jgi:hypothetical protein
MGAYIACGLTPEDYVVARVRDQAKPARSMDIEIPATFPIYIAI